MKNVPKILLKTYLRRQPVHLRLQQFNFLARYSWLKNLIEDLRPELFPPEPAVPEAEQPAESPEDAAIAAHLIDAQVRGQQGVYRVERWIGRRGQGYLFAAVQLGAKQPVVLKEFLLPPRIFSPSEARQRQQQFASLAGLSRTDGRSQDWRIVHTLDAIADTQSAERCYLVTDARDAAPTLRQFLVEQGALPPETVRQILGQVLQTLLHLHQQVTVFPSGQRQAGLIHGNLTLDSLLWVAYGPERGFVYLTDLALWERIFDPPTAERPTVMVTAETATQDLQAVGAVAAALLLGEEKPAAADIEELRLPDLDPYLGTFVRQLLTRGFDNAETAWQALLQLPIPVWEGPDTGSVETETETGKSIPRWLIFLAAALLLGGAVALLWRLFWREPAPASPMAQVCCFKEIGAVPTGQYVYTGLGQGSWSYVLAQQNLGQRGQSFDGALQKTFPDLNLTYLPAASIEAAIAAVQVGEAAFAILPELTNVTLPVDLGAAIVAYDALAVFVPYSYSERQRGLPQALAGELTLEDLTDLYTGRASTWRDVSRVRLPIKRYAPENLEAVMLFDNEVLHPLRLERLPEVEILPAFPLFRTILQDFENLQIGSIGFAPLSQVFGQCSIYPLALREEAGAAVQPLVLNTGEEIAPTTDLCNRKGTYFPNATALRTGEYPLAYGIMVVFPQDNSRIPVGQKFVELLYTLEGQQLLKEAGLVPAHGGAL